MALLASGFIKADRLSVFRLVYDFDPCRYIPSYSGLEDLELSSTAIDLLDMRATISTHILVEPTDPDVATAVTNFLSLHNEWKVVCIYAGRRARGTWDQDSRMGRGVCR